MSRVKPTLSILDLVPFTSGDTSESVLQAASRLAQIADKTGYERLWYAEHHNTEGAASNATSLLIAQAGTVTQRIRLGSGGIMLPNHSVLSVAEQFGTLAGMFPGRIDLGLGRAPGTDPTTAAMLRRGATADSLSTFEEDIATLCWYFGDQANPAQAPRTRGVRARIARDAQVPIWILGSSLGGATVAADLGLPFSFASHFAPFQIREAIQTYRSRFNPDAPTAQISAPKVMIGMNISVAPTQEEAQELFTSHQQMFINIRRGHHGPIPQPDKNLMHHLNATEQQLLTSSMQFSAVGTPEQVAEQILVFAEAMTAEEVILTAYHHEHALRERSFTLLSKAWDQLSV